MADSFYAAEDASDSLNAPLAALELHEAPAAPPRIIRICLMNNESRKTDEGGIDWVQTYTAWLEASLPKHSNIKLVLDAYHCQDKEHPKRSKLDEYDAILVSGSPADAFGDDPWITRLMMFLQEVAMRHPKIRIYGICFGHQIICRALGGTVQRNEGRWEVGSTPVRNTYMGKLLFGVEDLNMILFHQDIVVLDSLSDFFTTGELYLLGNSLRTENQGIAKFYDHHENYPFSTGKNDELVNRVHIMTTQGHPELTEKILTEMLRKPTDRKPSEEAHQEYFGSKGHLSDSEPIIKKDTGKRWQKHYDGVRVIGRTFWRMLGVDYGSQHPPRVPA